MEGAAASSESNEMQAPNVGVKASRVAEIEAELASMGLGIAADLGMVDGHGGSVFEITTGASVDEPMGRALELAQEWSVLEAVSPDEIVLGPQSDRLALATSDNKELLARQYYGLNFAMRDAWGVVHALGTDTLKQEWIKLLRETGEFVANPAQPSRQINERLYAALENSRTLFERSWTSDSLRDKVMRTLGDSIYREFRERLEREETMPDSTTMADREFDQLWNNICHEFQVDMDGVSPKAARLAVQRVLAVEIAAEREACIKAADDQWVKNPNVSGGEAIRARRVDLGVTRLNLTDGGLDRSAPKSDAAEQLAQRNADVGVLTAPHNVGGRALVVFLSFAGHGVGQHLDAISQAAAHMPAWWSVTEEERAAMGRLFESPVVLGDPVLGDTIRFRAAFEAPPDALDRFAELAEELAKKAENTKFILPFGGTVYCDVADGGFEEVVQGRAGALLNNLVGGSANEKSDASPGGADERVAALRAERDAWLEAGASQNDVEAFEGAGGYAAILADPKKTLQFQDVLDHCLQSRIIDVRNALRTVGWDGPDRGTLSKSFGDKVAVLDHPVKQVGAGANVVGVTYVAFDGADMKLAKIKRSVLFQVADGMSCPAADVARTIDMGVTGVEHAHDAEKDNGLAP